MASTSINYETWLSFSKAEQDRIRFTVWNTYERDGIGLRESKHPSARNS